MLIQPYISTLELECESQYELVETALLQAPEGAKSFNTETVKWRDEASMKTAYKVYYFPNRSAYYQC